MFHVCWPFETVGNTLSSIRPDLFLESAHPPSQLKPEVLLPEIKRVGRVASYMPPFSLEAKNEWNYHSTPCICLQGVYRHNISLQWSWGITNYKLLNSQEILCRFPGGARGIFLFESVQNSCGGWYSLLFNACQQLFRRQAEAGGAMKLNIHFNVMLRLRTHGVLPPFPQISSRCGA
jgi:hypothetical protein